MRSVRPRQQICALYRRHKRKSTGCFKVSATNFWGGVHGRKKHSKFIFINYLCDVKHMLIFIWCFFGCNSLVQPPDVSIITPENSTAADHEWWDFCAGQRLLFV